MIRILNITFVAITGLVCLGLYRIAEQARVAAADLRSTRAAIARESDALVVIGAEWARVTQPKRIEALVQKHLNLSPQPNVELSSLAALPLKNPPLLPEGSIRNAKAVMPTPGVPAVTPIPVRAPQRTQGRELPPAFNAFKTGT